MKKKKSSSTKKRIKKNSIRTAKDIKKRVSSGIPAFDKFIEGGFEFGSTNLLVGGPGSGKTIFATHFLIDGIKNNESCLYVTFEEKKEQFYINMKKLGFDLEQSEKKGKFTFIEYTPMKVKTMLEEGGGAIESTIIKNKITRVVIDSISSFEILFDNEHEKREASLELFNMLKKWNCTSVLTFEGRPIKGDKLQSRALEFESDAIILLHFARKLLKRERYVEILKMRGTNHSKEIHKFEIGKSGISINNKASKL